VAVATGEPKLREWSTGPADLVVPDAPAELGVRTFRDPHVFRFRGQWVMIVGAGLADGSGAAVQYRSADLKTWTCDGLLASRSADRSDAVFTGAVWECPQLFPLGDSWVLVVSVWDDDVLHYVAAAVGEYDGRHFRPRSWQRLTYGSSAYATSAFVDREGRRCAISWLREEPQNDPRLTRRAGAHSVPAVVTRTDTGRLALWPHPNLDGATDRRVLDRAGDGETRVALGGQAIELRLVPSPGQRLLVTSGDAVVAELAFGATRPELRIERPGRADGYVPISGGRELRLVLDADLLEIFGAGGYGAFRIGPAEGPTAPAAISSPRSRP
jgi:beta-fructofuranosidase